MSQSKYTLYLKPVVRPNGDGFPHVAHYQADLYHAGKDYHAIGASPEEALLELALYYRSEVREDGLEGSSEAPADRREA